MHDLHADVDHILGRISKDTKRPLLQNGDPRGTLIKIMKDRDPLYNEVADLKIDTTRFNIKQIIDKIYNHKVPV